VVITERSVVEPLKADLDAAGLRALLLERIEELEARKRDRKQLLTEMTAMAEEHGFDAGALKAAIDG
jgi:uncharacterized protein (UPF0335 family)